MRVALSGGGSAGHITPTLAVSDALRSHDSEITQLYIGQAGSMEERIVRAKGLEFASVRAGKFRREYFANPVLKVLNLSTIGPNARDALRTIAGVKDSLRVLRQFRPDVVFIKGGFVGVPVGIAARLLGIPYIIHESDVSPGLANRVLARWATAIAVGFPVKYYSNFDPSKLVQTGNPVRAEIYIAHRLEGLAKFQLDEDVPVVLVTGGSQGSRQINECVVAALPQLLADCQVIHVTGEGEFQRVKFDLSRRPKLAQAERYHPRAFLLGDMAEALAAADVVVGRAGVGSIMECAALAKPLILIPNQAMAGHQVANAQLLSRSGAARILDGRHVNAAGLIREIQRIIHDPAEQDRLGKAISRFGNPRAAVELAEVVIQIGQEYIASKPTSKQKPNKDDLATDTRSGEDQL